MKKANSLWIIWLMINILFSVSGGIVVANQLNYPSIPYIIAIFNFVFLFYYMLLTDDGGLENEP